MENLITKAISFAKRNAILVFLAIIVITYTKIDEPTKQLAFKIIGAETLALFLSGIAIYCLTEIDFVKEKSPVIGWIILAVHFLVGLTIVGSYIVEYTN